ncbi:MAG: hypothetical protein H0U46_03130 [Actinobacteria bacterium]|nr:hypothetical protein [Actinomycetota bacterium]
MTDTYEAMEILEIDEAATEEDEIRALQHLVNTGQWSWPGRTGRAMMDAIEAGYVALGLESAIDYYGNRIPSRLEVEAGTKGSVEFVAEHSPYGLLEENDV